MAKFLEFIYTQLMLDELEHVPVHSPTKSNHNDLNLHGNEEK